MTVHKIWSKCFFTNLPQHLMLPLVVRGVGQLFWFVKNLPLVAVGHFGKLNFDRHEFTLEA